MSDLLRPGETPKDQQIRKIQEEAERMGALMRILESWLLTNKKFFDSFNIEKKEQSK